MGVVESSGYDSLQQAYAALKKLQATVCKPAKHQAVLLRLDPSIQVWAEPTSTSALFILQTSLAQLSPCIVMQAGATPHAAAPSGTPTLRSAPATPLAQPNTGEPCVPPPPPSVLAAARATMEMQRNIVRVLVDAQLGVSPQNLLLPPQNHTGAPLMAPQGLRALPERGGHPRPTAAKHPPKVAHKDTTKHSLEMAALAVRVLGITKTPLVVVTTTMRCCADAAAGDGVSQPLPFADGVQPTRRACRAATCRGRQSTCQAAPTGHATAAPVIICSFSCVLYIIAVLRRTVGVVSTRPCVT